jgi:hypothetical protein
MSVQCFTLRGARRVYFNQALQRTLKSSRRVRLLSSSDDFPTNPSVPVGMEWRKQQLDKLEQKFSEPSLVVVDNDDDLQPMWKSMESRVTRRRPRTVEEMGGRTGRTNVKKTDEDLWLREGLYDKK